MIDDQTTSDQAGAAQRELKPRLLIVDDCEVHRTMIRKVAARAGFDSAEAANCSDVVKLTTYDDFEGATLDLSLGEEVGTAVLQQFAKQDFRAPIIILSGANAEVARKAHDLGESLDLTMLDAVSKPVNLMALREQLSIIARTWRIHQGKPA